MCVCVCVYVQNHLCARRLFTCVCVCVKPFMCTQAFHMYVYMYI
jgi:hypothetical protein